VAFRWTGRHVADMGTRCVITDDGHAIMHLGDPHDETGDRLIRPVLAGHLPGQDGLFAARHAAARQMTATGFPVPGRSRRRPVIAALNCAVMYRKTQQPRPEPLTRRDKRWLAAIGGLVLAALAGLGIWVTVSPGPYGPSHDGCVTVTAASSTGGAVLHECGARAVAMCESAFRHADRLSLLTRTQCRMAGLGPAPAPSTSTAPSGR